MSTKNKVLDILKENNTSFVSGQEIAERIFVTRAAIWKAIKALEKEGYDIEAVTNKGYRIKVEPEKLDVGRVEHYLKEVYGLNRDDYGQIFFYEEIGSTNDEAKRHAQINGGEPAIFIAESQTWGRGRRGREFFSPEKTGIYMSMLLYPDTEVDKASLYTCMMASAVCEAIEEVLHIKTGIKWVNDIFLNDKKVAGILTEGSTSIEDGSLEYIVIGVGINVYSPVNGFPDNLSKTAGALLDKILQDDTRSRLCAAVIAHFLSLFYDDDSHGFVDSYIERSVLTGNYVKLLHEKKQSDAYAYVTGIDRECRLCIRYDDGRERKLLSGEVSVVRY